MVLLIDGRAFDLQEETFLVATQQVNRFLRHLRQRRHRGVTLRVWRTGHRRLIDITVIRRLRPFPAYRHIAIGKESQQRFILTGFRRGGKRSRVGHNLVAARLRLLAQGFALPLARRRRFGKGLRAAAQGDIRSGVQQLFGNGAFAPFFQRIARAFFAGNRRAVAFTRCHMRYQRRGGGVLQLGGGNVAGSQPRRFRQLKDGLMRILMNIDAQRAVISLHAGGPGGGGGRRVGHVVRFPGFFIQRIMRVLPG